METAGALSNLASVYGALGDVTQKMVLSQKALKTLETYYGADHIGVKKTLNNLANAYGALGDIHQQKALLEKALVITERHFGAKHLEVASALNNLATVYGALGEVPQQKVLLEKAWDICETGYNKKHPHIAVILVNLANVYGFLGNVDQQKILLEKALPILEGYYGTEHWKVVETLHNLANIYGELSNLCQQKTLLEKVLAIQEKLYGAKHRNLVHILNDLSIAQGSLDNIDQQKELLERALAISKENHGKRHPSTATILYNLGLLYLQKDLSIAQTLMQQSLTAFINYPGYGEQHPNAIQSKAALVLIKQLKENSTKTHTQPNNNGLLKQVSSSSPYNTHQLRRNVMRNPIAPTPSSAPTCYWSYDTRNKEALAANIKQNIFATASNKCPQLGVNCFDTYEEATATLTALFSTKKRNEGAPRQGFIFQLSCTKEELVEMISTQQKQKMTDISLEIVNEFQRNKYGVIECRIKEKITSVQDNHIIKKYK